MAFYDAPNLDPIKGFNNLEEAALRIGAAMLSGYANAALSMTPEEVAEAAVKYAMAILDEVRKEI